MKKERGVTKQYQAKDFRLFEAKMLARPRATSLRDYRIKISTPFLQDWTPGQFVMIRWGTHQIGRPFAIVSWEKCNGHYVMELWIRRLGAATEELFCEGFEGMSLWVTAPLGTPLSQEIFERNSRVLFVSGGVGAASLLPIWQARQKLDAPDFWIHGERRPEDWDSNLQCGVLCLESGAVSSRFVTGRVTEALSHVKDSPTHILVCGPTAMLEAVGIFVESSPLLRPAKCFLGLEEKMGCGIGLCFSCSVRCGDTMERCCTEGPWFEYASIRGHFEFRGRRPDAR